MKKLVTLLTIILMAVMPADAKSDKDDLSCIRDMDKVSYVRAEGGLLRSGLFLEQYGISEDVTKKLKKLQIVVVPVQSRDFEKCRQMVRQLVKDMDEPFNMATSQSNVVVWGNANKNDVYEKVIIGVGARGKVTYVFMQGEVTGSMLSYLLSGRW